MKPARQRSLPSGCSGVSSQATSTPAAPEAGRLRYLSTPASTSWPSACTTTETTTVSPGCPLDREPPGVHFRLDLLDDHAAGERLGQPVGSGGGDGGGRGRLRGARAPGSGRLGFSHSDEVLVAAAVRSRPESSLWEPHGPSKRASERFARVCDASSSVAASAGWRPFPASFPLRSDRQNGDNYSPWTLQLRCSSRHTSPAPRPSGRDKRAPWTKNVAPTYAGIFLWFVFWQDAAQAPAPGGALGQGVVWALVSLVLAALICYFLFYLVPGLLGSKTGLPLYIVGTSTFGAQGGFLMPGFLMGLLQFGWLGVNTYFSSLALASVIPVPASIIMVVWGVLAAFVGLKGIQYVARVSTYLPLIPLAILLLLLAKTIGSVGSFSPSVLAAGDAAWPTAGSPLTVLRRAGGGAGVRGRLLRHRGRGGRRHRDEHAG